MKVTVKILKGGECTAEVTGDDTVIKLKQLVAGHLHVDVSEQRLVFKGKTLPDDKSLALCNVTEGSKIFLMVKKSEEAVTTPDLWTELQRFLSKHMASSEIPLVLEKFRESFEANLSMLSLDDIERLATSHLQKTDT